MKGVNEMSPRVKFLIYQLSKSGKHACLLISYERVRRTIHLKKSLEDLAKSWSSLFAGDGDSKRNDLVIAVDSSEDTNSILLTSRSSLLNQVVG